MQPTPLFAIILAAAPGPHREQMLQPTHLFALILVLALAAIVVVLWVVLSTIRKVKVARMQSEIHAKLVDKVSSSQDFSSFFNSKAGKQLVASITSDHTRRAPYRAILRSVRIGTILLCLGIGFLIIGIWNHVIFFVGHFLGGLLLVLGASFLISAWVSYRLSKKFGLINHDRDAEKPLS